MRSTLRWFPLAVLTVGMLLPDVVLAQPGGGGRGGGPGGPGAFGGGMIGLLQADEVQQEIELMDDQREQVQALAQEMRDQIREEARGMFQGMRDLSREERRAQFDELRSHVEKMQSSMEGRLDQVLLPHQLDRLKQIDLQARVQRGGADALTEGKLAETLGLTDAQREQLRQRAEEVQRELEEKIGQLRVEARGKLMEVLTPEQRTQLESMLGEEFAVPDDPGGGRQFGFGGRRGGGRRGANRGSQSPSPAPEGNAS